MKLSVIIVSYNVKYFLEQCLHSVQKACAGMDAEIIVIDNNSTDDSIDYLLPGFQNVIFIRNRQNLGFGKANNQAAATARGEYILLLNPDTILPEDCIDRSIAFLDAKPAAALGIRMIDGSGRFLPESKRSFPTTAAAFYKLMGLSGMFPSSRTFNKYSLNYLDEHSNHSVEVLSGAFMLMKRAVFEKVGGFDEAFFMYGEDIDLSYRIKQAGFENWYFAETAIIHFKGESTKKESLRYLQMFYKAMLVFVDKHYKGSGAWFTRSVLKTGIALRGATSWMFGRNGAGAPSDQKKYRKVIIGNDLAFAEVMKIIAATGDVDTASIIHINESVATSLVKRLQSLSGPAEIIFCIDDLSYKDSINILQQLQGQFRFRFHAKGSNSIVGSDSKEFVGSTIASH